MALFTGMFKNIFGADTLDMISGGPMYTFGPTSFDNFDFYTQLGRTTWEEVNGYSHPGYEALGLETPQYWEPLPEADGELPAPGINYPTPYSEPTDPEGFHTNPNLHYAPWKVGPVLDADYHYLLA